MAENAVSTMLTETALKRFTCEVECKALGDDGKPANECQ